VAEVAEAKQRFEKNPQGKYDCPKAGQKMKDGEVCTRTGENGMAAPQAIGRHLYFAHGIPGSSATAKSNRDLRTKAEAEKNNKPKLGRPKGSRNASHVGASKGELAKSTLVAARRGWPYPTPDRQANIDAHRNAQASIDESLNHCPRCGDDIAKIRDVTGVTPHRCPACRMNLSIIQVALSPDLTSLDPERVQHVFSTILNVIHKAH
jgi:hypothetical protein